MPNLGFNELLVILLLAVLLFGGSKLPGLGKSLGEGIKNFKRGIKGEEDEAKPTPQAPQHAQTDVQPPRVAQSNPNQALGPSGTNRGHAQDNVVDVDHRDVNR